MVEAYLSGIELDAACWASWGESIWIYNQQVPPENLCLLLCNIFTYVTFLIHKSLLPAGSCIFWCWSCFVCSALAYEI